MFTTGVPNRLLARKMIANPLGALPRRAAEAGTQQRLQNKKLETGRPNNGCKEIRPLLLALGLLR